MHLVCDNIFFGAKSTFTYLRYLEDSNLILEIGYKELMEER